MRRLQSFYAILATIFAVAASILTFFLVCIFGIPDIGLLLWFLNYTEYLEDKIDMLINEESYDMIKEEQGKNS